MAQILLYPHPALERVCKAVDTTSVPDWRLIHDMEETMAAANGMGLAANQIGVNSALFIMSVAGVSRIVSNPSIVADGIQVSALEGCLSLPGIAARVPRYLHIKLKCHIAHVSSDCWDEEELELHGSEAQCVQHEADHLNGILYPFKLAPWMRRALLGGSPNLFSENFQGI